MRQLGFRARLFIVLFLFASVPALVVTVSDAPIFSARARIPVAERRPVSHECAPRAAPKRNQMATLHEGGERLPQCRARDPQLVRKVPLGRQAAARRKDSEPDRRSQTLDGLLEGGGRLDRLEDGFQGGASLHGARGVHPQKVHAPTLWA